MKLFGQIVRTVVNAAVLPVVIVKDVITAPVDVMTGPRPFEGTREQLEKLKDEAQEVE